MFSPQAASSPTRWADGSPMPAWASASTQFIRSCRCWGSMSRASCGLMVKRPGSKSSIPANWLRAPTRSSVVGKCSMPRRPETTRSQKAARSGAPGSRTAMPMTAMGSSARSPGGRWTMAAVARVPSAARPSTRRARARRLTCSNNSETVKVSSSSPAQRSWKRMRSRLVAPASKYRWSTPIVLPVTVSNSAASRPSSGDRVGAVAPAWRSSRPWAVRAAWRSSLPLGVRGSSVRRRKRPMRT